jgi:hypothetical protein
MLKGKTARVTGPTQEFGLATDERPLCPAGTGGGPGALRHGSDGADTRGSAISIDGGWSAA